LHGIQHACNAFETSDRGLVFIDCTGLSRYQTGPADRDMIVDVQLGTDYIPRFLFSNRLGNITWTIGDMGTVTRYQICWIAGEIMDYQYDFDAVAFVPPYVPPYGVPPPPPPPSVPVCRSCCEDRCSKYQGVWRNGCMDDCMRGGADKWSWK
jgi:hypothetical protein